ncbi:MAG: hypothetical protein FWG36_06255 [Oscillospiraceae bacterium]|nr:hypothetical protein [Oscillospiraceae bacterium]
MPKTIQAIFDSMDSADNAVAGLRRQGISIMAYRCERLERGERGGLGIIPAAGGAPGPMMMAGGALNMGIAAAPFGVAVYAGGGEDVPRDAVSDEVVISIAVDDTQSDTAESALISMGGRSVSVS